MQAFGEGNGYSAEYIGDWNHPRDQRVVEYLKDLMHALSHALLPYQCDEAGSHAGGKKAGPD